VAERGLQPLPLGITPHKLRHTFASILVAIGKDPTSVMQQLGHTDPAFTLRVYSHMMRRSDEEREELKALVEGRVLAGNRQGARISARHGPPEDHF
jgi:integrase